MVILPSVFSDGAVFLEDSDITVNGKTDPEKKVTLTLFDDCGECGVSEALSDEKGEFSITFHAPKASFKQYTITLDDGDVYKISDLLFGEVWLAAGQSNMEYTNGSMFDNKALYEKIKMLPIRFFRQDRLPGDAEYPKDPVTDTAGEWHSVDDFDGFLSVSACASAFIASLSEKLSNNVPVAFINSSVGGTPIESWLSKEYITGPIYEHIKDYWNLTDESAFNSYKERNQYQPTVEFNLKTYPLLGIKLRGVIWYQGESNAGDRSVEQHYMRCLRAYREMISRLFSDGGNFPMICSSLFSWLYCNDTGNHYGYINETFYKMALSDGDNFSVVANYDLPATWMVRNNHPIHPANKYVIGERMAECAYNMVYGGEGPRSAPLAEKYEFCGDAAVVTFRNTGKGLHFEGKRGGFYVADERRVYYPATAKILSENKIVVFSPSVSAPSAVAYQYAFMDKEGGLWGDMPAYPFASDEENEVLYYPKPFLNTKINEIFVYKDVGEKSYQCFYYPLFDDADGSRHCNDDAFSLSGRSLRVFSTGGDRIGVVFNSKPGYLIDLYKYRALCFCAFNSERADISVEFSYDGEKITLRAERDGQVDEYWKKYRVDLSALPKKMADSMGITAVFMPDSAYKFLNLDLLELK